ncbi:MAG: hypothetical protein NC302_12075 [Bacteroidales bacterium]|nr:hypothetical protein [Bacteroidales bacterium]MCM1414743.1 hypothetical protein [bacterium]MCM1422552.1 hypothetical protein [bacterium]
MCKERLTALFLASAVAISGIPTISVRAEEEKPQEKAEEKESGEENTEEVKSVEGANETIDAYNDAEAEWKEVYIRNAEDLKNFAKNCRLDTWSQNKKVYLTADLDLRGENFVSIPTFGGYFDGQGHTISGFAVHSPLSYVGLFNETQTTAVIADLKVEGTVRPTGKQMVVGGIVGDNSGILLNCAFDGIVEASDYVGGIAGCNEINGVLMNCETAGTITGTHYTGGIAGDNIGNISGCRNLADINTSNEDKAMSLEDINLGEYAAGLFNALEDGTGERGRKLSAAENMVDTGGIAGLSTGILQNCVNEGMIGYEHVGYNVGGIVGRQSGYVHSCVNQGKVYGRKDAGGIVGQAEPYIAVDLSEDIVRQLSDHIDTLHDQVGKMLDDAGDSSDTLSNRLSVIRSFADKALDDTHSLADQTTLWTDGMMDSVNEAVSRFDYVLDETAKDGGVVDHASDAAGDARDAAEKLEDMVKALDLYQYMTPEEKEQYDKAKAAIEEAGKKHAENEAKAVDAYENYYIGRAANEDLTNEYDLKPVRESGVDSGWAYATIPFVNVLDSYLGITGWVHYNSGTGEMKEFPLTDGSAQAEADRLVQEKANQEMADNSLAVAERAAEYADKQYRDTHGGASYSADMQKYLEIMTDIASRHSDEMTEDAKKQLEDAASSAKSAAGNLQEMGSETKDILTTLNDKSDIAFPRLGDDYRSTTGSLDSNLKNISENMGYLNDEMSSSGDLLGGDLSDINDLFSEIMLLYTDALDGVLDMDYSDRYEDESQENAEESIDATIADCTNSGNVEADLNVSGIAGTMAIEYDFDLESDVTGIDDARANSTFLTKCVLRQNVNQAKVTAQKSYAGGVCGLQEMGMILRSENYGRIESTAGDYVGGIAGQSLSHIRQSYAKCTVAGGEYVAGIAGWGNGIEDSLAMVKVKEADAFFGAIAGQVSDHAEITGNYFVSDELAGIDRISYSGKAEPVSYRALLQTEGIPYGFRQMKVTFYADDEEVGSVECPYGGSVELDQYPKIPVKEGFYADWDNKELTDVRVDEDVTVEYVRYLTTLAGSWLRENGQSSILADGMFAQEDEITVDKLDAAAVRVTLNDSFTKEPEELAECWQITIPDDDLSSHKIRYQAPQGQTEGVEIYVQDDNGWHKAETEMMGIYYLFDVRGSSVTVAAVVTEKGFMDYIGFVVGGGVVLLAAIGAVVWRRRKKRKMAQAEDADESNIEKVE